MISSFLLSATKITPRFFISQEAIHRRAQSDCPRVREDTTGGLTGGVIYKLQFLVLAQVERRPSLDADSHGANLLRRDTRADVKRLYRQLLRKEAMWRAGLFGWCLLVAMGWFLMVAYGYQREAADIGPPSDWPADSQLPRSPGRECLVIIVHPKCPCSQATVAELEQLLAALRARRPYNSLELCVVATIPRSAEDSWAQTPLIQRSLRLTNARLFLDRGGVEAERFGAQTSGTVLYFDAAGRQRYAGGVTASRGQEGENAGWEALARILLAETPSTSPNLPVFGCRLVLEASPKQGRDRE